MSLSSRAPIASVVAGVDVGSTLSKAVLADVHGRILGRAAAPTGASVPRAAARVLAGARAAAPAGSPAPALVVTTGYGRFGAALGGDAAPEIACHARGAAAVVPGLRTLIDIGGQDTKVIRVGPGGQVLSFVMNDKCAAGTGRFLDSAVEALGLPPSAFAQAAEEGPRAGLSSICAVFAQSEIVALLADRRPVTDVLRGVCDAVADRIAALAARLGVQAPLALSGGVSGNPGVVAALARRFGVRPLVPPEALFLGAVGAAALAADRLLGGEAAFATAAVGSGP